MHYTLKPFLHDFREPKGILKNLESSFDRKIIHPVPGAYVLMADKQFFVYPNGKSRVYYIGQSINLNHRLSGHIRRTLNLAETKRINRKDYWFWPRYQYGAKFGINVFWFTTRGTEHPKDLELKLMDHFYNRYHSIPVANGAFSFGRLVEKNV